MVFHHYVPAHASLVGLGEEISSHNAYMLMNHFYFEFQTYFDCDIQHPFVNLKISSHGQPLSNPHFKKSAKEALVVLNFEKFFRSGLKEIPTKSILCHPRQILRILKWPENGNSWIADYTTILIKPYGQKLSDLDTKEWKTRKKRYSK